MPEERLISWGWDLLSDLREHATTVDRDLGVLYADQPEAPADLPAADAVVQSVTLALILRRPGE